MTNIRYGQRWWFWGDQNNHTDQLSEFDDNVTMIRWDGVEAPVEVDEAKADEEEEDGERKGKKKKRLSKKSSGDWARE